MNCIGPTARSNACRRRAARRRCRRCATSRATREPRPEDRRVDDAVRRHQRAGETSVVALDLADRGDQLPGEVARGVGLPHHRLGALVGRQRAPGDRVDRGVAGVDDHAEPGPSRRGSWDTDAGSCSSGSSGRSDHGIRGGGSGSEHGPRRGRRRDGSDRPWQPRTAARARRPGRVVGGRRPPHRRLLASPVSPDVARAAAAPTAADRLPLLRLAHQGVSPSVSDTSVPWPTLRPHRYPVVPAGSSRPYVLCPRWHRPHVHRRRSMGLLT